MGVLNEYKAAHPAAPVPLARKMDGALLAIGTLSDVLKVRSEGRWAGRCKLGCGVEPCDGQMGGVLAAIAALSSVLQGGGCRLESLLRVHPRQSRSLQLDAVCNSRAGLPQ